VGSGHRPTRQQRDAVAGGKLRVDAITIDRVRAALGGPERAALRPDAVDVARPFQGREAAKEIDVAQFRGEPFVVTDDAPIRFDRETMLAAARGVMPDADVVDAAWLEQYDAYYYDRSRALSLPVLRVRYADSAADVVYLDPRRGAIVRKERAAHAGEPLLYHGLHSLDFPFLYYRRPLWDLVVIALSIGGIVLSATTLIPASIDCGGMCVGSEENDMRVVLMIALLVALAIGRVDEASAASCESLASLSLPDTTITMAQIVAPGAFAALAVARWRCTGSVWKLPVVLPHRRDVEADERFRHQGRKSGCRPTLERQVPGGRQRRMGGTISYPAMAEALQRGYATTSTDTGHVGGSGLFALGHPEKFIDFAYRSTRDDRESEAIVGAFYGSGPKYFVLERLLDGWTSGTCGRPQRFPEDFDGIIAGAQANPRTRLGAWHLAIGQAALKDPAAVHSPQQVSANSTVRFLDACDAIDGVKDGLINDPPRCHFDPKVLTCKGPGGIDGPECLTPRRSRPRRSS